MVAIFGRFLYVFVASLMVGVGFGLGTAILLKVLRSHSAPQVSQYRYIVDSKAGSNADFTCGQLFAALTHSSCLVLSCGQAGRLPGIAISCRWLPAAAPSLLGVVFSCPGQLSPCTVLLEHGLANCFPLSMSRWAFFIERHSVKLHTQQNHGYVCCQPSARTSSTAPALAAHWPFHLPTITGDWPPKL